MIKKTPLSRAATTVVAVLGVCVLACAGSASAFTPTGGKTSGENTPLNLTAPSTTSHSSTGSASIVRTIVGLAIVIAVIWGLTWILRQVKSSKEGGPRGVGAGGLASVGQVTLSSGRSVHLVRAGNDYVLVGSSEQGVVPIHRYCEQQAREAGLLPGAPSGEVRGDRPSGSHGRRRVGSRDGAVERAEPDGRRACAALHQPDRAAARIDGAQVNVSSGNAVQILLLVGALTLIPAALFTVTGFSRILIVLGFIRTAVGTTSAPPNQVLVGIALFLTIFVMAPTISAIDKEAVKPLSAHQISTTTALRRAEQPLREFMFHQTRVQDISLFVSLAHSKPPKTRAEVPTEVLIPAFIVSELKTGFQIGFLIFLPFLVIDLIVSSTLMSMGMIMLPPTFISLPFKILLFILVDGWDLVIKALVQSFH